MNNFRILAAAALGVVSIGAAFAQDFTDSGSFTSAIQSNYYQDPFAGWSYGNPIGNASYGGTATNTYTAPGNGAYDWTATSNFGNLWSDPTAISTDVSGQSITFTFAGSSSTSAFGGTFYNADISGVATSGSLTLTFYNGSTVLHTYSVSDSFYGYVSSSAITSVVLSDNTSGTWVAGSNLYDGAALPAPEPTTMVGLGIAGMALLRRRRNR